MAGRWLLGTSALLALRDNEEGARRVAGLLQRSQRHEDRCLVCFMSHMEVHCRVWNDEGERAAAAALEGAVLVHMDPEFQALGHLSQEWLA